MEPTPRSRREIEEAKRLDHDLQALDQGAVGLDTIKAFALPGADEVVPEVEPAPEPAARVRPPARAVAPAAAPLPPPAGTAMVEQRTASAGILTLTCASQRVRIWPLACRSRRHTSR